MITTRAPDGANKVNLDLTDVDRQIKNQWNIHYLYININININIIINININININCGG